ncbi:MAG: hypothetical protein AABM40_05780 [Chloroflexota bacterium]
MNLGDLRAHPREWVAIAIGAAMILGFFLAARELLIVGLGALLVVAGLFGDQVRILKLTREGLALETWKREVARRVVQNVTGRGASTMPAPTIAGRGTVTNPPADETRAPTVDEISDAKSPQEFADRLVQVVRPSGIPSAEAFGTPAVRSERSISQEKEPD